MKDLFGEFGTSDQLLKCWCDTFDSEQGSDYVSATGSLVGMMRFLMDGGDVKHVVSVMREDVVKSISKKSKSHVVEYGKRVV